MRENTPILLFLHCFLCPWACSVSEELCVICEWLGCISNITFHCHSLILFRECKERLLSSKISFRESNVICELIYNTVTDHFIVNNSYIYQIWQLAFHHHYHDDHDYHHDHHRFHISLLVLSTYILTFHSSTRSQLWNWNRRVWVQPLPQRSHLPRPDWLVLMWMSARVRWHRLWDWCWWMCQWALSEWSCLSWHGEQVCQSSSWNYCRSYSSEHSDCENGEMMKKWWKNGKMVIDIH